VDLLRPSIDHDAFSNASIPLNQSIPVVQPIMQEDQLENQK
jgi:hypothetical protein